MRGEIPNELLTMGQMVNVDFEDHRHEYYKKTPVVETFKGSGHTLGSATPNIEIASAALTDVNNADDEKLAKDKLKVDNIAHHNTANSFGCSIQFE